MDIFEQLENLNVSEECFDDIMSIVEDIISEKWADTHTVGQHLNAINNSINKRWENYNSLNNKYEKMGILNGEEKIPEVHRAYQRYSDAVGKKRTYSARMGLKPVGDSVSNMRENKKKIEKASGQTVSQFDKNFSREGREEARRQRDLSRRLR